MRNLLTTDVSKQGLNFDFNFFNYNDIDPLFAFK